jgi:hypothetical protein
MVEAEHARQSPPPLLTWALAAFHTALFVAVLVALAYRNGSLGNLLGGLSTELGFAIYAALWLSVGWCTGRTLRDTAQFVNNRRVDVRQTVSLAPYWGAGAGGLFLGIFVALFAARWLVAPLLLVGLLIWFRASPGMRARARIPVDGIAFGVGILLFGIPLLIGAAVGLALALVDSLLLEVSLQLFRMTIAEPMADRPEGDTASD